MTREKVENLGFTPVNSMDNEMDKKRELFKESVKRLGRELDIMGLVSEQRLSAFVHKLLMSRHQRWLINKSQRFNLAPEDPAKM